MKTIKHFPKKVFYGWWIVMSGACAMAMFAGLYFYGVAVFFDSLAKEFKTSRTALSGAFSMARAENGLTGPIEGILADRFGPRKIMLIGVSLMAGGFIVMGHINTIIEFYIVFFLMSLGGGLGFYTPVYTAVGNWFVKKRGTAFGLTLSGLGMGGLFVPMVGWLIVQFGWRAAAQIIGIIIFAVGIPAALTMRHKPEQYGYLPDGEQSAHHDPTKEKTAAGKTAAVVEVNFSTKEALMTPAFWLLSLSFSIRLMVTSALAVHIMPFLLDSGFDKGTAAAGLGAVAVISVVGRLGFGWLGDHAPKRYVVAGLLLMVAVSMLYLGSVNSMGRLVVFLALYAPAYGGLASLMQSIRGEYFGRKSFGGIMGFMSLVIMLGSVSGPLFAGIVWDVTGNYRFAFSVFAMITFVAVGMILAAKPPVKREMSAA